MFGSIRWIILIFVAITVGILMVGCDPNDPNNPLIKQQSRGLGLTRTSFGPLNTQRPSVGASFCGNSLYGNGNANPDELGEQIRKTLSPVLDSSRNTTGQPDATLVQEELTHYFDFLGSVAGPVVRIIHRDDDTIDFWFYEDGVLEAHKAELAAQEYCKSHDGRTAQYAGFSYKCGEDIKFPLIFQGKPITVKEEQWIVAYNCVGPTKPQSQSHRRQRTTRS